MACDDLCGVCMALFAYIKYFRELALLLAITHLAFRSALCAAVSSLDKILESSLEWPTSTFALCHIRIFNSANLWIFTLDPRF